MMKKSIKKSCALLIACALTLSAFAVLPKANAANMVDTGKKDCSIDFKTAVMTRSVQIWVQQRWM